MFVSFKNTSNKVIKYEINPNDKMSSIVSRLFEDNKTDPDKNTIKFIFKGHILNHEKLFSEFTEEYIVIVYMITKIKHAFASNKHILSRSTNDPSTIPPTQVNSKPVATNVSTSLVDVQPLPNIYNQQYQSDDNLDSVDKLRAAVIGTLVFIRANPQLAKLFNNNFETLMNVMTSNQIRPLFEKLVSESDDGDSGYLDDLSESLLNVNSDV